MISLILIALAAIFDAQKDKIQFDPLKSWFPSAPFWITRNYMEKRLGGSWVFDTVLSFANDGWHFCKSVSLVCLFAAAVFYTPLFGFADIVIFYCLYGVTFTLSYKGQII